MEYNGKKRRVGAVYRRISDEYIDPLDFHPDSMIGIPGVFRTYRKGNVALMNTPGNGIADDKGIYYFVPKMIRYYLGEEPLLQNAPTYLPFYPDDMKYVLDNFDNLVHKDVAEAGGYGVLFGNSMTKEEKSAFIALLKKEPRRFIAQEVINFRNIDILEDGQRLPRKADLRAFVITGKDVKVWKSGLTRFSRNPDSFIVNSSQGGRLQRHMGIFSSEKISNLYWLGRYVGRTQTTLKLFMDSFDRMIDGDKKHYQCVLPIHRCSRRLCREG